MCISGELCASLMSCVHLWSGVCTSRVSGGCSAVLSSDLVCYRNDENGRPELDISGLAQLYIEEPDTCLSGS